MAPPARIALSYHNSCLYERDVALLRGPHWLNDVVIGFWLEVLEHEPFVRNSGRALFVCPDTVQLIKLDDTRTMAEEVLAQLEAKQKDFVFFPLNDNEVRAVECGGGGIFIQRNQHLFEIVIPGRLQRRRHPLVPARLLPSRSPFLRLRFGRHRRLQSPRNATFRPSRLSGAAHRRRTARRHRGEDDGVQEAAERLRLRHPCAVDDDVPGQVSGANGLDDEPDAADAFGVG